MARNWTLRDGQRHLATHTTRLACVIEAIERKLVVRSHKNHMLRDGVEIKPSHGGTCSAS